MDPLVIVPTLSWLAMASGGILLVDAWRRRRRPAAAPAAADAMPRAGAARRWWRLRWLQEHLSRAGLYDVTPRDFALVSAGVGLLAGLAAQLVFGWVLVSLVAGGAGAAAPALYYARRRASRRAAVQAALAEAIDRLRYAQEARLSVQSGLDGLVASGPVVLRADFARFRREQAALGFPAALAALQARLADPVWDTAALALLVNHHLGSRHVGPLLARLAAATRAELRVRATVRAQQAQHETSARIVAAVPVAVLVGLRLLNPAYVAVFDTPAGQAVLAGCAVLVLGGYAAMRHVARLPAGRRIVPVLPAGPLSGTGSRVWPARAPESPGVESAPPLGAVSPDGLGRARDGTGNQGGRW